MLYTIHQIQLTNKQVNDSNRGMMDKDTKEIVDAFSLSLIGKEVDHKFYKPVAKIKAETLEEVFSIGNVGPEEKIERLGSMHSISVGNLIEDEDSNVFRVAPIGFVKV